MHIPRTIGLLVLAAASLAASSPVPTATVQPTPTSTMEMMNKAPCGPHEFCQFGTSTAKPEPAPCGPHEFCQFGTSTATAEVNPLGFSNFDLGHFGDGEPPVKAMQTASPVDVDYQVIETTATTMITVVR